MQDKSKYLQARLYSHRQGRARWCAVPTQFPSKRRGPHVPHATRYPQVEALFEDRQVHPYIHNTIVRVIEEDGREHQFLVFCQNHIHLPLNQALQFLWRGDIVVMRITQNRVTVGTAVNVGIAINARADDNTCMDAMINM